MVGDGAAAGADSDEGPDVEGAETVDAVAQTLDSVDAGPDAAPEPLPRWVRAVRGGLVAECGGFALHLTAHAGGLLRLRYVRPGGGP